MSYMLNVYVDIWDMLTNCCFHVSCSCSQLKISISKIVVTINNDHKKFTLVVPSELMLWLVFHLPCMPGNVLRKALTFPEIPGNPNG